MSVSVEDTGMCECGHTRGKHRDRGAKSCRKCDCKSYTAAIKTDDGYIPKPHEPDCTCGRCAWERLKNAERNLLSLKGEIERLDKSLILEMDVSSGIALWLDKFKIDIDKSIEDIKKRISELSISIKNINEKTDMDRYAIIEKQNEIVDSVNAIIEVIRCPKKKMRKGLVERLKDRLIEPLM